MRESYIVQFVDEGDASTVSRHPGRSRETDLGAFWSARRDPSLRDSWNAALCGPSPVTRAELRAKHDCGRCGGARDGAVVLRRRCKTAGKNRLRARLVA